MERRTSVTAVEVHGGAPGEEWTASNGRSLMAATRAWFARCLW